MLDLERTKKDLDDFKNKYYELVIIILSFYFKIRLFNVINIIALKKKNKVDNNTLRTIVPE